MAAVSPTATSSVGSGSEVVVTLDGESGTKSSGFDFSPMLTLPQSAYSVGASGSESRSASSGWVVPEPRFVAPSGAAEGRRKAW